jgi:hypothetical protein
MVPTVGELSEDSRSDVVDPFFVPLIIKKSFLVLYNKEQLHFQLMRMVGMTKK